MIKSLTKEQKDLLQRVCIGLKRSHDVPIITDVKPTATVMRIRTIDEKTGTYNEVFKDT